MNNYEDTRGFLVGSVINTFALCILIAGFSVGYILDLGSFRRSPDNFIFAGLFLLFTIVFYVMADAIIQYKRGKKVKTNENLV